MRKKLFALMACLLIAFGSLSTPVRAQQGTAASYVAGERNATWYNFGKGAVQGLRITNGNTGTGSQTITICPAFLTLPDGRSVNVLGGQAGMAVVPLTIDPQSSSNAETVTPTAVTLTTPQLLQGSNQAVACGNVTASFTFTHAASQNTHQVISGDAGLQEAMNDAFLGGGGSVTVDNSDGATDVLMYATIPYPSVSLTDKRKGTVQYWNPQPNTTALATPTALTGQAACDATHTFCSDATVAGSASWGAGIFCGITYLDIMGNESITSTTATFTSVASKAIDIGAPIASTGAIAWKPYCSLSGGTYALAYSLPLLLQPTVLQAVPLTSSVCQLSPILLQIGIAACNLVNTNYNTTSSTTGAAGLFTNGGAQFTLYPLVTSMLAPNLDSASAQSLNPSNGGHTVYKMVPSNHVGVPGVMTVNQTFPITTAAQSTIGQVAGTIKLPWNFMNYVGRTIEVCGLLSKTSTTADTITNIQLWWDAEGSNVTAGTAVQLSNIQITQTLTAAASLSFCQDITTTVAAATATGGTIVPGEGWFTETQVAAGTIHAASTNVLFAAVGSLNLALPANIEIVYNHTTGTDGAGVLLINPIFKILN